MPDACLDIESEAVCYVYFSYASSSKFETCQICSKFSWTYICSAHFIKAASTELGIPQCSRSSSNGGKCVWTSTYQLQTFTNLYLCAVN